MSNKSVISGDPNKNDVALNTISHLNKLVMKKIVKSIALLILIRFHRRYQLVSLGFKECSLSMVGIFLGKLTVKNIFC